MKKGQTYTGIVERVVFPNKGIIKLEDEKTVIVKNVIPGQKISFIVNKVRKGRGEGRLLEILERSPFELDKVPCDFFGICGGCCLLNLSYEKQLEFKAGQVKTLLELVCGEVFEDIFEGIRKSPRELAYRNKMEFSFGDSYKDGPLTLGMHKRESFHDIITVAGCKIADKDYSEILSAVLSYFQMYEENSAGEKTKICYYHKMKRVGYLRHLLVRKAVNTGEILVDLVTTTQLDGEKEKELLEGFKDKLLSLQLEGKIVGILNTHNDSLADAVINQGTQILYGVDYFYEELLGLRFRITPFSFFQTNSLGAEVLYQTVREYIADAGNGKIVYDLYSGTGTIAQMLASVAKKVIGVEIVEEAVEAAKENALLNGLHNCEFLAGDVLKVLDNIEEKPDFIVLDPPREGIHPKALERIISYGVEKMIYISCKPTSLARDLEVLQARGYEAEKICCVDMFPGTVHVESIVLLSKLHTKQNIEVELEMSEMDLTAAESKATYEEIKNYVLEHTRLKVSSLYIAQVKEKCEIIERVNYNQSKSENSRQPKCPPEKEAAIREALKHFRMI